MAWVAELPSEPTKNSFLYRFARSDHPDKTTSHGSPRVPRRRRIGQTGSDLSQELHYEYATNEESRGVTIFLANRVGITSNVYG